MVSREQCLLWSQFWSATPPVDLLACPGGRPGLRFAVHSQAPGLIPSPGSNLPLGYAPVKRNMQLWSLVRVDIFREAISILDGYHQPVLARYLQAHLDRILPREHRNTLWALEAGFDHLASPSSAWTV